MMERSIKSIFIILLLVMFSGCVGPPVRTYEGNKLPKSEVAVIKGWYVFYLLGVKDMYIYRIDDGYPEATKVEVLPGRHELVIKDERGASLIYGGGSSRCAREAFNFEAGHEYKIKYLYKGIFEEGVKIIDVTTGAMISSQSWSECVGGI